MFSSRTVNIVPDQSMTALGKELVGMWFTGRPKPGSLVLSVAAIATSMEGESSVRERETERDRERQRERAPISRRKEKIVKKRDR